MRTPDYRRDAEHQQADANDAARAEGWHRDDWADDEAPTRGELDRDEFDWERERWRGWSS
jgi:hypothetical protein